jgi:hypothetical protein
VLAFELAVSVLCLFAFRPGSQQGQGTNGRRRGGNLQPERRILGDPLSRNALLSQSHRF